MWTSSDTPGSASFCTRAAWKWPGASVTRRTASMGKLRTEPEASAKDRTFADASGSDSGLSVSRQQLVDHVALDVGQAEVAALEAEGQLRVVQAEQVQDRG